ncbi:hypothetical protein HMPREF0378_0076 [Eubacterium nodatum ATCC 33099]|nr:hypothetical protein HMPREF0378_0076 [Eubacterium nodatum ATCC 33099]
MAKDCSRSEVRRYSEYSKQTINNIIEKKYDRSVLKTKNQS